MGECQRDRSRKQRKRKQNSCGYKGTTNHGTQVLRRRLSYCQSVWAPPDDRLGHLSPRGRVVVYGLRSSQPESVCVQILVNNATSFTPETCTVMVEVVAAEKSP